MNDALRILMAVDGGARLWVGRECRDVTAVTRRVFRAEATRQGADPAAAAARLLDKVAARADRVMEPPKHSR